MRSRRRMISSTRFTHASSSANCISTSPEIARALEVRDQQRFEVYERSGMNDSNLAEDQNDTTFAPAAPVSAVQTLVEAMRLLHGDAWGTDEEANLRFTLSAGTSLKDIDGAHLIGEPEIEGNELKLTF